MTRALTAVLMAMWLLASACDPSDPCDPDYEEIHGACYPRRAPADTDDAAVGLDDDGGSTTEGDAAAEPPSDPYEGFGDECEDASDCRDGLICGAPQLPMCTQVNCMAEPSICPPDWTCFDTTGVSPDPSVTSICLNI